VAVEVRMGLASLVAVGSDLVGCWVSDSSSRVLVARVEHMGVREKLVAWA
jgi:hypothetical protein